MTVARRRGVVIGPLADRMAQFLQNCPRPDEIAITSAMDGEPRRRVARLWAVVQGFADRCA